MAWKVSPHWAHKIFIDFFSSHSFPRYISSPSTLLANNYYSPKGPAGDMPKKWRNSSRILILSTFQARKEKHTAKGVLLHSTNKSSWICQLSLQGARMQYGTPSSLLPIIASNIGTLFNVFWPWWRHSECKKHPWLRWCARDKAYKGHTVCGFWQWHFYHSWCW